MISIRPLSLRACGILLAAAPLLAALTGCGAINQSTDSFLGVITPYRIDIVQGNAVTKEQVALIKPGMNRDQVQAILGPPMLSDPFHAERWDYPFSLRRPGTGVQRRTVVAHFDKAGALTRLDAPSDLPDESAFVASIVPVAKGTAPTLELTAEQRSRLAKPAARKDDAASTAPQGAARSYPPLEPR